MTRVTFLAALVCLAAGALAQDPPPEVDSGPEAPRSTTAPSRVDPHHPSQSDSASDGSCSACHVSLPEPGSAPAESALRLEPADVCSTCHRGMPHQGAAVHLGKEVRPENGLPASDGTIACFTCHDVHRGVDAGLVSSRFAASLHEVAARTAWAGLTEGIRFAGTGEGHSPMLRRSLDNGALCRACHGVGP